MWPYWASNSKTDMLSQFERNQVSYWHWNPEAKFSMDMGNRTRCEYKGGCWSYMNWYPVNPRVRL